MRYEEKEGENEVGGMSGVHRCECKGKKNMLIESALMNVVFHS